MRLLVLPLLLACGAPSPALRVLSVSPAKVGASDNAALTIKGEGFVPTLVVDLDNRAHTTETSTFNATLANATDSYLLTTVTFSSTTELKAKAPAALVPGTYELRVTAPNGASTTLAHALEVTP